jgi:hypothetical protein
MGKQALFKGLVVDEYDRAVDVAYVGDEPCYVVNDAGFHRHIPSEQVDRQVLHYLKGQIEGNEDVIADQTAKMLGQEDPFSRAMIENQFKNFDLQLDQLMNTPKKVGHIWA